MKGNEFEEANWLVYAVESQMECSSGNADWRASLGVRDRRREHSVLTWFKSNEIIKKGLFTHTQYVAQTHTLGLVKKSNTQLQRRTIPSSTGSLLFVFLFYGLFPLNIYSRRLPARDCVTTTDWICIQNRGKEEEVEEVEEKDGDERRSKRKVSNPRHVENGVEKESTLRQKERKITALFLSFLYGCISSTLSTRK